MGKKKAQKNKPQTSSDRRKRVILEIAGAILVAIVLFFGLFYINQIEVVGNSGKNYTDQEVIEMSLPGLWSKNSALLRMFRRKVDLKDVRFMENVEVEFRSNNEIRLHVNEKKPIGFVRLNERDFYFDHEGVVLEIMSSEETAQLKQQMAESIPSEETIEENPENVQEFNPNLADVPMVTGLEVMEVPAGSRFPVSDPAIFNTIQSLTKMIDKYGIQPDYVEVTENIKGTKEMVLYYGPVRAALGSDNELEEKVTRLAAILPKLAGRSGVLHLEEFTVDTVNIVFDSDL